MGLAWAWECVCVDAEQAKDVWACPVAKCAWVMARLDGDRDQACGVRKEADEANREANTAGSVANAVENPADIMGAGIAIDPCEYVKNNSSNPASSAQRSGRLFFKEPLRGTVLADFFPARRDSK